MSRRTYKIAPITVNEEIYYELKHSEELPEDTKEPFNYYVKLLEHKNKTYRLVWLLEDGKLYIGIVNAFRDSTGELQ